MILFEGAAEFDYFPIYRNEITMASMKQNDQHVSWEFGSSHGLFV